MDRRKIKPGFGSLVGRSLLAGALATGAAAAAAGDVFLRLDGITGESTDSKHKGEIDILSYTQSFTNNAAISAGGGGSGRVTCGAVTVLKNIDRSSPGFIRLVTTGAHVPKGVITFRTAGESPIEYYKVTLTDVIVTAVNQTDSPDPGRIIEQVSMLADRFQFEYTPIDAAGRPGATTKFGWDCAANRKF